jgi:hypothetical protein
MAFAKTQYVHSITILLREDGTVQSCFATRGLIIKEDNVELFNGTREIVPFVPVTAALNSLKQSANDAYAAQIALAAQPK